MTVRGEQLLRDELKILKSTDRPKIIKAIATAREFGDLKEIKLSWPDPLLIQPPADKLKSSLL